MGQNLYISYSTAFSKDVNWRRAIISWFDEYKLYTFPDDPNKSTGHYTQVIERVKKT